MTVAGWVFMTLSLLSVVALAGWCYSRVLGESPAEAAGDDDDQRPERLR